MSRVKQYEARLGPIRVGLRKDLVFTRQEIRGNPSYVVHDPLSFQNHVFDQVEYRVMTAIITERSLWETFDDLASKGIVQEEDKKEYYEFILGLHGLQLLQLPISDPGLLFERYLRKQQRKKTSPMRVFVYHKVPLWDPDMFLQRTLHVPDRGEGPVVLRGGVHADPQLARVDVDHCVRHHRSADMAADVANAGHRTQCSAGVVRDARHRRMRRPGGRVEVHHEIALPERGELRVPLQLR